MGRETSARRLECGVVPRKPRDPLAPFRLVPGSAVYELLSAISALTRMVSRMHPSQVLGVALIALAAVALASFLFGAVGNLVFVE